jgi:CMP-N-acetylneuraminic acid synthetase
MGKFPRRIPVEMSAERSVDLDTMLDWVIAETIMNHLNKNDE